MQCNGFKVRGLNPDCDKLGVQSSEQSTWFLGKTKRGFGLHAGWKEVGLQQNELMVLRAYDGACPVLEIEALGDKCGVLVIQRSRGATFNVRVGSRVRLELGPGESAVLRCEWMRYPRSSGVHPGAYGRGLAV